MVDSFYLSSIHNFLKTINKQKITSSDFKKFQNGKLPEIGKVDNFWGESTNYDIRHNFFSI